MPDRPTADPSLAALRQEIERIDRGIVLLLAARLDVAGAAIRYRSHREGRIENPAQEARVLARAREWGEPFGVSDELTDTVFRMLIEAGKARFAAGLERPSPVSSFLVPGPVRTRVVEPVLPAPTVRAKAPAPA